MKNGPSTHEKQSTSSSSLRSNFDLIHYIELFKNLLKAQGDTFHPKVRA
jgi:hypothetical protein